MIPYAGKLAVTQLKVISIFVIGLISAMGIFTGEASRPAQPENSPYPTLNSCTGCNFTYKVYSPVAFRRPFREFSYYIASQSNLLELGKNHGRIYAASPDLTTGMAILSFGAPEYDDKVYSYDGSQMTISQVEVKVKDFIDGFYEGRGQILVNFRIVVGVNSSTRSPSYTITWAHGANWGTLINTLNTYVHYTYDNYTWVTGGMDIEQGDLPWRSYSEVLNWVNGYSYTANFTGYNFGCATGCPLDQPPAAPTPVPPVTPLSCDSNWDQEKVRVVSSIGDMEPLPLIYNTTAANAQQWYHIGLYAFYKNPNEKLRFWGEITQYYACEQKRSPTGQLPPECVGTNNSPQTGYQQFYDTLSSDPFPGRVPFPLYYKSDMLWFHGDPTIAWMLQ
jgi:hypothetical protein